METVCDEEAKVLFTYPSGFATSTNIGEELDGAEFRVSCFVSCISMCDTKSIGLVVPG